MTYCRLVLVFSVIVFAVTLSAQDIYHSQFNRTPFNINPALTGAFNGDSRVIANYRDDRSDILRADSNDSYAIGVDTRKQLGTGDFIGFGLSAFKDKTAVTNYESYYGALSSTQVSASLAYGKLVKADSLRSHYLVGGAQFGLAKRSRELSKTSTIAPSPIDCFFGVERSFLYADVNFGLAWLSSFGDRKSFYLGVAAFHANTPDLSFSEEANASELLKRIVLHGGGEFPLTAQLSLAPSILYLSQGAYTQVNGGTSLRYYSDKKSILIYFEGGVFYRSEPGTDAIVFSSSVNLGPLMLGLSYDYVLTDLRQAGLIKGAFEFTVGYIIGRHKSKPHSFPRV